MARHTDWSTLDNIAERLNAEFMPEHHSVTLALTAVNEQLALHGVEFFRYPCLEGTTEYRGITYVNAGDTYVATICYDDGAGEYLAASWGDLLEAHESTCDDCRDLMQGSD